MKKILLILITLIVASEANAQNTSQELANSCGLSTSCLLVNGDGIPKYANVTYPTPAVLTPATSYPTPATATFLTGRYSIIAAGAPTAAYVSLRQGSAITGSMSFGFFNQGSNPVAIVPYPGDTLNVSAAATPYSCTTLKYCECTKLTATNWGCTIQ